MKVVRLNEDDAALIARAFLPHNPNKLRGPLETRQALKDACHRFREAVAAAAEPNSDASFLLGTLQGCLASLTGDPGAPPAVELIGALRIAVVGLESGQ